jgi:hypothetical protein
MNNKKLIITIASLLLVCSVYLSWTELRQADLNTGKNWWALSFADPKSFDPSFVIENHSTGNSFHWTVLTAGKTKLREGDVNVPNGEFADVKLNSLDFPAQGKIMIDVSAGTDKKEIYKDF